MPRGLSATDDRRNSYADDYRRGSGPSTDAERVARPLAFAGRCASPSGSPVRRGTALGPRGFSFGRWLCVRRAGDLVRGGDDRALPRHGGDSLAQQLANTYAPVVMLRAQKDVCSTSQEQFAPPTSVDVVLGNPAVRLLRRGRRGTVVVKRAPTAADLAERGSNYYLDLPGDPLNPGCRYAKAFRALRHAGRAPSVTYVHITTEPGQSGLAVQYWFYYYFNQFNDLHESDWEGIQLTFAGVTPAEALTEQPSSIVLSQHAGGEHTTWDDDRVQKEGTS